MSVVSSVVELLSQRGEASPDNRAYTFLAGGKETKTVTFSQLSQRAKAIAVRLNRLKARGERVLLLYPPGLEYISAFYGCIAAAAVAVPAYPPRLNRNLDRLESIVSDATPKVVLTTGEVYQQMRRWFDESPLLARLDWVLTGDVSDVEAEDWTDPEVACDTLAFLQYTSGSTSKPKGVMVSHANLLHNERMIQFAFGQSERSIIVGWLPLYHDMGLIGTVLQPLYLGAKCVLMPPMCSAHIPAVRWLIVQSESECRLRELKP